MLAEDVIESARTRLAAVRKPNCPQSDAGVIVVCAPTEEEDRELHALGPELPPYRTVMEDIAAQMNWKVGPLEFNLGAGDGVVLPANAAGLTVRLRF